MAVRPTDDEGVARALREAGDEGRTVLVEGGGTKPGFGLPVADDPLVLETGGLTRAVALEPGDFVCVAQAGMRLADLQAALAADAGHRQRLMLDPPHGLAQTLGGIVSTNASGPLRHRYGAPRDLVLGARFVTGDGTVAKTGGRVVKNVAGYDLSRLLCGSLGSLAVITELTFKLHPVPPSACTVVVEDLTADGAGALAARLRTASLTASAIEALWPERVVAVRLESSEQALAAQVEALVALAPGARRLGSAEAVAMWEGVSRRPWHGEGVVAGVGVPPARVGRLLALAEAASATVGLRLALGVGELRLDAGADGIATLRAAVETLGGQLALRRAPAALQALAYGDRDPVALDLMRAVKQRLDPGAVLPSRLFAPADDLVAA